MTVQQCGSPASPFMPSFFPFCRVQDWQKNRYMLTCASKYQKPSSKEKVDQTDVKKLRASFSEMPKHPEDWCAEGDISTSQRKTKAIFAQAPLANPPSTTFYSSKSPNSCYFLIALA